jgi:hypothetical protein
VSTTIEPPSVPRPRIMVTEPRAMENGPHSAVMIPRPSIRMMFLPGAVGRGFIEAPWADTSRIRGRLLHVVAGDTLAVGVKAEWRTLTAALAALSDLDMKRVNHGVAVNMDLVDVLELHHKVPRVGFNLYHNGGERRTIFVRLSRAAARAIRRDYER